MHATTHKGTVALLLVVGTVSSLFGKSIYLIKAPGRDGSDKLFRKPLAVTLLMFVGMLCCLPCSLLYNWVSSVLARRRASQQVRDGDGDSPSEAQEPLLSGAADTEAEESSWSLASLAESTSKWWEHYDAVIIPTLFDLVATVLMSVGLLFTTVSV